MKFIKNYKFILFLTIIFIFSSLFSILYIEQRELPSENWSKEIKLETYLINNRYDSFRKDNNELLKIDNEFYLIYFSENSYFLNVYDKKMDLINKFSLNKDYDAVNHLYARNIDNKIHINFTTNNNQLMSLVIDYKGNIFSEEIIDKQVKDVRYYKNNIAYLKDDGIYLNNDLIYQENNIENFTFTSNNNHLNFAYIKYNLDTFKYDLNILDYSNKIVTNQYIYTFALDNVTDIFDMDLSVTKNEKNLVVITENIKANVFTNITFKLDNNYSILSRDLNYSSGYNFKLLDNSSNYIQNTQTNIGRIDISTKNKSYPNVALFKDESVYPLTKTKLFPNTVNYYTFNEDDYIVFTQTDSSKEISIYLASTNPELIEKSQYVSFKSVKNIFLNTITTFLPLFLFGQIYSILFLIPIFIIILPFSLIKLTWAEQNQGKLLAASIVLFTLAKSKYVFFDMELHGLPIIFTNPILRLLIALTFSGVAIYSMIDISKDKNNHFLRNFIIFFIIDMITFTLFFTPYFLL